MNNIRRQTAFQFWIKIYNSLVKAVQQECESEEHFGKAVYVKTEQEERLDKVTDFLLKEYPEEFRKWVLDNYIE